MILAEGLPAETYLDTGNRSAFENAGPGLQLHPRFGRQVHTALACAPFAESGRVVDQARARILARAEAGGFARAEGAWRVEADGVVLASVGEGYDVPQGTRVVRILSDAWCPAEMEGSRDTRLLGVCLTGIAVDGVAIALDDAALGAGCYPAEGNGCWRWTNGAAEMAVPAGRLVLTVAKAPVLWQEVA